MLAIDWSGLAAEGLARAFSEDEREYGPEDVLRRRARATSCGPEDADCGSRGLKAPSLIRLGSLAVLPEARLLRAIGAVAPERHRRLLARLATDLFQQIDSRGQTNATP